MGTTVPRALRKVAAVALSTLIGAGGLVAVTAAPAQAHHNSIKISVNDGKPCAPTKIKATWAKTDHRAATARLVVDDNTGVHVAGIGEHIQVGPFPTDTTIAKRVFGGGERNYDLPLWNGFEPGPGDWRDSINAYGAEHGWDWTLAGTNDANPFTGWKALDIKGCPPKPAVRFTDTCDGVKVKLSNSRFAKTEALFSVDGELHGPLGPGEHLNVTVAAEAVSVVELHTGKQWSHQWQRDDKCPQPTTPPTPDPTVPPTTPPTPDPTDPPASIEPEPEPGAGGGELPETSGLVTVGLFAGGGLAVVLLGSVLLVLARKRRFVFDQT